MSSHRPRKRFGQHFLHERGIIQRIVAAFDPKPSDHVVEIGPGEGVLTRELVGKVAKLDVVELDRDLIERLRQSLPESVWEQTIEHPERGTQPLPVVVRIFGEHIGNHMADLRAAQAQAE